MREKLQRALPAIFATLFLASRWPGLLPPNFSAAYALCFCAGVFFRGRIGWSLPIGVMFIADVLLNVLYYRVAALHPFMLTNYAAYLLVIWLGRRFRASAPLLGLLAGSLLGAILFYLITNTAAWLQLPDYSKDLAGWLRALTFGTDGWPETWKFFRNTLTSTGLFTALFAGSWKLTAAESPQEKGDGDAETEAEPEEAKA
jgi:hypothetical protein